MISVSYQNEKNIRVHRMIIDNKNITYEPVIS